LPGVAFGRKLGAPLSMRLVALRKPPAAAIAARRKARLQARKESRHASAGTLAAAEWVILVTSLSAAEFPSADILKLYRLRWRIELAFKRLKSLIGLRSPPADDPRLARPWVLSLMIILLTEPLIDEFGVSPS
jgi:IS4 transposase